jgi:hypothetical protein
MALALSATAATPAAAQLFFEPFAYRFQIPAERDVDPPMRPGEAAAAARAQGFDPASRPHLNRDVYVFDARDGSGRPVRVIMDAYEGEILRIMPRVDARTGRRFDPAPPPAPEERTAPGDEPEVIEGFGPDETPAARPRRESQPARRAPKREAAVPPRVEQPKPIESRPLDPPKPAETARPVEAQKPVEAARPAEPARPAAPPSVQATPTAPPLAPTEEPGPIPSPPFASGAYSKPPAPKASPTPSAAPPVAPLDEVKPRPATPAVPPASLE